MSTKNTYAYALIAVFVLVLGLASSAYAQRSRQIDSPQRRAGFHSVPALTNPRNAGQSAQDCNATYSGFRLCDWLRPSPSP